jgi:hypothetical protein
VLKLLHCTKTPEDRNLGPKHVVSKVKVIREKFVVMLTDCVVRKRFRYSMQQDA